MTTTHERVDTPILPERLRGQGLDPEQYESGDRAIHACSPTRKPGPKPTSRSHIARAPTRSGRSAAWFAFSASTRTDGRGYDYRIIEQIGENPIANQDRNALATIDGRARGVKGLRLPRRRGQPRLVEPEHNTYPFAYERIAQLFDSPNAPDLAVNPKAYAFGRQPGQHGALDVIQARSPLVFSGPGVKHGALTDAPSRQIDIAPTLAKLLGFPLIDGKDITGRTSSERGAAPDVYLKRQDGRVLDEIIDDAAPGNRRASTSSCSTARATAN